MEKQTGQKTKEKIKVTDIDIVVADSKHFYYGIKYKKYGENEYNIGYGSYNIEQVIRWRDELFEIVKEQKQEENKVTNEELLEHLKEIEIAVGCTVNSINTLFYIIDGRQEELNLDDREKRMIQTGMLANASLAESMCDLSGLKKRAEQKKERELVDILLKLL